ncbi:MAG: selenocysteine-specific translation elongation factor [Acidobacteria bacterium RIFCSPLOWO2_02_FULL_65_29]|nr:MAG: selenocysteine-specific translation elongation factor [Acidobacteria bacterium RIFCSPLOWO2_02_FULL_65_29]
MSVIIGTAGHIDHGKTSLVKALTGQDTDRLKEEKERGISIDLGFAHLDLPGGIRAGVVDVPGHERFIHNMLAGAHGIDLVLFTVAADDGVMPQTEEHLDIVHLLGVKQAIFVITKVDLATEARIGDVAGEIGRLVGGTSFEQSPMLPCSVETGEGLANLRALIAERVRTNSAVAGLGGFRLPVDRVFVMQGHGLVVTGTALAGEVRVGETVRCLPGDQVFRVRSLQVHNQAVAVASQGQRVAMNVAGPARPSIMRGHVICHQSITATTDRFDAFLNLRSRTSKGLKNRERVRVHMGTAERLATVQLLDGRDGLGPRDSAYCQIRLREPLLAMRGDRFIIRNETAQRTIGGGVVVHPSAGPHKRREAGMLERLESLHRGDAAAVVDAFLEGSGRFTLATSELAQLLNVQETLVEAHLKEMPAIRIALEGEGVYTTAGKWQRQVNSLLETLRDFHEASPLAPGMELEQLRDALVFPTTPKVFRALVDRLAADGVVAREASLLRLAQHAVRPKGDDSMIIDKIQALLSATPMTPPALGEIETRLGIGRARLSDLMRAMERNHQIVRVAPDLYFLKDRVDEIARTLREHCSGDRDVTPGAFRDMAGTTRKYAIPLLEYFDRTGLTVRVGDVRRLKRASAPDRH